MKYAEKESYEFKWNTKRPHKFKLKIGHSRHNKILTTACILDICPPGNVSCWVENTAMYHIPIKTFIQKQFKIYSM